VSLFCKVLAVERHRVGVMIEICDLIDTREILFSPS
jgi:hypothetical protein